MLELKPWEDHDGAAAAAAVVAGMEELAGRRENIDLQGWRLGRDG